jgi:hypothetical protein
MKNLLFQLNSVNRYLQAKVGAGFGARAETFFKPVLKQICTGSFGSATLKLYFILVFVPRQTYAHCHLYLDDFLGPDIRRHHGDPNGVQHVGLQGNSSRLDVNHVSVILEIIKLYYPLLP